jgi:signal transduction histidine kinase
VKLRLRVILLLLAVLLPAFGGFAWIMTRNVQHMQDAFRAQVLSRAQAIRVSMDQELERREAVLELLVNSPELQRWDVPAFCQLARSTVHEDTGAIVMGRGGKLVMGTTKEDCRPITSGLGHVPDPITSGRFHLSDVFTRSFGDKLMALFMTFVREGSIYELSIGVAPVAFQNRLEQNQFEPGWTAAVMNPIGRVLARTPDPDLWVGKMGTTFAADRVGAESFWKSGVGPSEGVLEGRTADGVPTNVVFSRSDRYGLTVFISYPQAVAESKAHSTVAEEMFIAAGLMLLGLMVAAWAGRKISAPADTLRRSAEDLKAGRAVALQRYGVPEFDSVASSLEEASATIRSHSAELTRRIDEAVAEARSSQLKLLQAQKLEVVGRLAGGIAHDFNNLLQTLSTGLSVLQQTVADAKSKPLIEAGLRAVGRASRLVQQLLAIGRSAPFDRQSIDVSEQLTGMEVLLARTLPKNIRLRIEPAADLWRVLTDASQFEVALLNLIFNARDALPNGGLISVSALNELQDGKQGVALRVVDNGEGIAPEILEQVFEPFVTTKPAGRGTGLGLSQVRDFATASDGVVSMDSAVGVGTTVRLWLPRAEALAVSEQVATLQRVAQGGAVLLVEDDALIGEVVSSALAAAGFDVRLCPTADEALRRLRSGYRPDVVFSDIVMAGSLSGLELVDVLHRELPQLPVVLATGFVQSIPDPPPCILLTKPYSIERLVEVLNEARRHD